MSVTALGLEMLFPLRAQVAEVTKYRWHRLPNNWLAIQETIVGEDFSWPGYLNFPRYDTTEEKQHCVKVSSSIVEYMYHMYKHDRFCLVNADPEYHLMAAEPSLHGAMRQARLTWTARLDGDLDKELSKIAAENTGNKERALEQVENVVSSVLKRNPESLTKADFSYIFVGPGGRWCSYYPSLKELLEHFAKGEKHDAEYKEFLESKECATLRECWENEKGVIVEE